MRARNIKPGFFDNEDVGEVSHTARLLFIGLWCLADRNGILEYRPKKIKLKIFPYDPPSLNLIKFLEELSLKNLINLWVDSDKKCHFIEIPNFLKHQKPHPGEKKSNLKELLNSSVNLIKLHEDKCNFGLILGMRNEECGKRNNEAKENFASDVCAIIDYLNVRCGKKFQYSESSREPIMARLKEGHTVEECMKVIDNKFLDPDFDRKYLQPSTLFRKSNFENYLNHLPGMGKPSQGNTKQGAINGIQQIRRNVEQGTGFNPYGQTETGNGGGNVDQVGGSLPRIGTHSGNPGGSR